MRGRPLTGVGIRCPIVIPMPIALLPPLPSFADVGSFSAIPSLTASIYPLQPFGSVLLTDPTWASSMRHSRNLCDNDAGVGRCLPLMAYSIPEIRHYASVAWNAWWVNYSTTISCAHSSWRVSAEGMLIVLGFISWFMPDYLPRFLRTPLVRYIVCHIQCKFGKDQSCD